METKTKQEILDLYDLMLEQLRDLYDGERQQLNYLLKADEQVTAFELDEIIQMHRRETKRQLERIEEVFKILNEKPTGETCDGIKGIIDEALKLTERCKNPEVRDAALVTAIQHINHYEIAGYGTAIAYAKAHEQHDIAELLLETLREEKRADMGLSDLAQDRINPDAKWTNIVEKSEK
ncbi:YciE/YciF ferroxidase family protein [Fodinibius sp. AD559]|uniref:YciE/YciF ferroxidase family protein n=1 Tax=Fodinibius sp. AD559 TaxID=3424179 RepID=UPI004046D828